MTWFGWLLIAYWALTGLLVITKVGKPARPTSPGVAALVVLLCAAFIVGVLTVGVNR